MNINSGDALNDAHFRIQELGIEINTLRAQIDLDHRAKLLMLRGSYSMRDAMREAWLIMDKVDTIAARDWKNKNERFYL